MEGDRDIEWTLDALQEQDPSIHPPLEDTYRLVAQLTARWIRPNMRMEDLWTWTLQCMGMRDVNQMDFSELEERIKHMHITLSILRRHLCWHGVVAGVELQNLKKIASVLYYTERYARHSNTMLRFVHGDDEATEDSNALDCTDENMTNFQSCFMGLCEALNGCGYRRADGEFFTRVVTRTGMPTMAFKAKLTVEEFIKVHTARHVNFKFFCWASNPPGNMQTLYNFMKEQKVAEAPDLVENCHYRSYEGDSVRRGAGVYDSAADFFFPYAHRTDWSTIAADATARRRVLYGDDRHDVAPPLADQVCVVHLNGVFPHDTYAELLEVSSNPLHLQWREAQPYECANPKHELDCPDLGRMLDTALPVDAADEAATWGRAWVYATLTPEARQGWRCLDDEPQHVALVRRLTVAVDIYHVPADMCVGVDGTCYVRCLPDDDGYVGDDVLVPLETPPRRPRVLLDPDDAERALSGVRAVDVRYTSYVRCGARYFRPDTGRTWLDCACPEIDRIYDCQHFGTHDRFFLYAYKGRLFFDVGEMDRHEGTLIIIGIGGCGKSTIMKAVLAYFPPHLRGIMSSNMQPQFGMAAVLRDNKSRIVCCNEVAESLSVVQEEWQACVSGDFGSFAVKNKQQPLVCTAKAQQFWVGNCFPKKFNNEQGQVSRRLAGVLMPHPVQPRDGTILHRLLTERMGALQRKMILAYHEFVRVTGTVDPMSLPKQLPPAFYDFYRRGRSQTNTVQAMLDDSSYVVLEEGATMLLREFKELHDRYLTEHDMRSRVRWGEDVYRTPFAERGITVNIHAEYFDSNNVKHVNQSVVAGLRAVV